MVAREVMSGPKVAGAYEAADRWDRALASWAPAERSADGDVLPDKRLSDTRVLDAVRNDAYIRSGTRLHRDSIVGTMFVLNAKPRINVLGLDESWAAAFQEEVESKFELWAESENCWVDASRRNTLTSLVRLAVGVYVSAGEAFATAEWMREGDRPFRTAIQMIEPARVCNPGDRSFNDRRVRGGVRISASGAPVGYYIRRALPGTPIGSSLSDEYSWSYVRARNSIGRPQVIHILEQERPGQNRGVSQLVSALKEMRILKRFRDVTLQSAALRATFAAVIKSELPSNLVFEAVGGGDIANGAVDYARRYLEAVQAYGEDARNMSVDGARIPHMMPGSDLDIKQLGAPTGVGDFEADLLRYLASSLDVSFEQLSKDYTKTNYSSARAGMLETYKHMQARKKQVADRFAWTVFRLWFEEAVNAGDIEAMRGSSVPNMYDGLNMEAFTAADWIGAGHGQIDEYKETQAMQLRIQSGVSTYENEIARFGKDWRRVFAQRKREKELMEELDIMPMMPDAQGNVGDDEADDDESGGENDGNGSDGNSRNDD